MAAFNGFGNGHLLLRAVLIVSVASLLHASSVWGQTGSSDDSGAKKPDSDNSSATALTSCLSIKNSKLPVWTVDNKNTLRAGSVLTSPYTNPGGLTGSRFSATTQQNINIVWRTIETVSGLSSMQIETSTGEQLHTQWVMDENCQPLQHRRIIYDHDRVALELQVIDPTTETIQATEALNPPLPAISRISADNNRVRVGLVDSGINYTLPQINSRLARNDNGDLIGYDFWENDQLPFDVHFSGSPFRIVRHGTGTASLLLKEAPFIDLVPYRYPRPDMSRMQDLVEHAAKNQVHIIGMPLGGNAADQWSAFADAAEQHPDILFIASAGNNGRNIDQQPVYPAALDIENLLVVTSADDFIVPADRVNWGRSKVDYMLPAEQQSIIDFNGEQKSASGSSYAVPRAAALAARLLRDNPQWRAPELIAEFARRYADGSSSRYVSGGYIADPLAEDGLEVKLVGVQTLTRDKPVENENEERVYKLPVSVYVLHEGWSKELVSKSLLEAENILAQCNIAFNSVTISELSIPAYMRDLEAGSAKTLISALNNNNTEFKPVKVFYARNTRMLTPFDGEAFGRGNTRRRPWLQNSVWLTNGIKDAGIALAHELYHVLSNSGEHNQISDNLMQTRTTQGNTVLEPMQCEAAIRVAQDNLLLFD